MQRQRIRRVTTAGLALVTMAFFLAACSSSSGGGGGSGSGGSGSGLSGTLNGSGSTLQLTFQQAAIQGFKSVQPNVTVNYGAGGSGKGRTDLAWGTVNYAGSDSPIPVRRDGELQGQDRALLPRRDRPGHGLVQPVRRQEPEAVRAGHRGHLPGQDHEVERLGDRGG